MTCRQIMPVPTWHSAYARGWKFEILEGQAKKGTLGACLLEIPQAHPAWDCYYFTVIHLRDLSEVPPAHKQFETATHEFMLWALDSRLDDRHDGKKLPDAPVLLTPPNFVEQVELFSDEMAVELFDVLAQTFVNGLISPDTDYRAVQRRALQATAAHLRAGLHCGLVD